MAGEFDLIQKYFAKPAPAGFTGVGDDCALIPVRPGFQLATSTDLLIEGRHFFPDVDPARLGHKALAVNLSDLAAMGAEPLGCLLSLSLPRADAAWLDSFSSGFHSLANRADCPLLGGDTTRSDIIVINVTVMGQVRSDDALRRSAAVLGDDIWVTGMLGAADVALRLLQGRLPADAELLALTRDALELPQPPVGFAQSLAGLAHAALDISDGLVQDLGHITAASRCGAELYYADLPVDPALARLPLSEQQSSVLGGGDVYQLCFTAAPRQRDKIHRLAQAAGVRATIVGRITDGAGVSIKDSNGTALRPPVVGFDHFA